MKFTKIAAALLLSVLFVACCPCRKGKSVRTGEPLIGTNWQLTQMYGQTVSVDNNYSLLLNDDKVSGVGDCNRLMGGYTTTPDRKLSFTQMASTRMFCPNQQQEDAFLKMLGGVDAYKIDGNMLMLLDNGELVAIFEAVAAPKK